MGITKSELRYYIRRFFGYPNVKVELTDSQIDDAIFDARNYFIKWAVGNATQEVYFTMLLQGGQRIYDLPTGVTEILTYVDEGSYGAAWPGTPGAGINTLFTFDNYMYNNGQYSGLTNTNFEFVSYHLAKDYLETVDQYSVSKYNWRYIRHTNQLEIMPTPSCDGEITSLTGNSPDNANTSKTLFRYPGSGACSLEQWTKSVNGAGWILLRTYMIEGSTLPVFTPTTETSGSIFKIDDNYAESLYEDEWIRDFTLALCKIRLGNTRRKFASFQSIGNMGIQLDGDQLISEGMQEKMELLEKLKLEQTYEGYPILIG